MLSVRALCFSPWTAVMEYLAAEVGIGKKSDEKLNKLLSGVTVSQSGVLSNIHAVLLLKSRLFNQHLI
jgi:hypothetical protein